MDLQGRNLSHLSQGMERTDHQILLRWCIDGDASGVKTIGFCGDDLQGLLHRDGIKDGFYIMVAVGAFTDNV